jgi:hypothetical protein
MQVVVLRDVQSILQGVSMLEQAGTFRKEDLSWIWAYRQALTMLDRFDAEGLAQAKATAWKPDVWMRFLGVYGLKRGAHSALRDRCSLVFEAITPILRQSSNPTIDELNVQWADVTQKIGAFAKLKKDGSRSELRSMSSKILWFYFPSKMTMYDGYARKALQQISGKRIGPQNYLAEFINLFAEVRPTIETVSLLSDRAYPFPCRVLDQWLWLKGSGEEELRLRQLALSLSLAPIRKRECYSAGVLGKANGI